MKALKIIAIVGVVLVVAVIAFALVVWGVLVYRGLI
jgi:hypothetical protein